MYTRRFRIYTSYNERLAAIGGSSTRPESETIHLNSYYFLQVLTGLKVLLCRKIIPSIPRMQYNNVCKIPAVCGDSILRDLF